MTKDYNTLLCEAIDTIVSARLSTLEYNKTVICTIVSVENLENGQYQVFDGINKFTAFSDSDTKYVKDQKVYVLIPNGDWSSKKIILNAYQSEDDEKPMRYISPRERLAIITTYNSHKSEEIRLIANKKSKTQEIFSENIDSASDINKADTIYIRGLFKTFLEGSHGTYGLSVDVTFDNGIVQVYPLSSKKDMYGDPYNYQIFSLQEMAYKLPKEKGIIKKIECSVFALDDFNEAQNDNIFVKEIEVAFGINIYEQENRSIRLITTDSLEYTSQNYNKTVSLFWFNKTEDNQYLGFNGIKNNKDYAMGNAEIPSGDTNRYQWIEWQMEGQNGALINVENENFTDVLNFDCLLDFTQTRIYARVWENGTYYSTDSPLVFTNADVKNNAFANLNIKLSIENDKNSEDSYPLYGEDNKILDSSAAFKQRTVKLSWAHEKGEIKNEYWYGATIKWEIPSTNTMLEKDGKNYVLEYKITEDTPFPLTFNYRIKNIYLANSINNTIKCTIITAAGAIATAEKTFSFASRGTMGTSFTLVVKPKEGNFGFTDEVWSENNYNGTTESFEGLLYDKDGVIIEGQEISLRNLVDPDAYFEASSYNVIVARTTCQWLGKSINLQTLYPVIYSRNGQYYAQAPAKILYDSFGSIMGTNRFELHLFDINTHEEIKEVDWEIFKGNGLISLSESYPYTMTASLTYLSSYSNQGVVLIARDRYKTILWSQPLIFEQYRYESEIINNWDGSLKIDNDNNVVMSAAAIFGTKDNNEFTGVILGEIGNASNVNPNHSSGLIGYHNGVQSFGFLTNGTGFIGKAGSGRIEFDGTKGFIASDSKEGIGNDQIGLYINVNSGEIDLTTVISQDGTNDYSSYFRFTKANGLSFKVNDLELDGTKFSGAYGDTILDFGKEPRIYYTSSYTGQYFDLTTDNFIIRGSSPLANNHPLWITPSLPVFELNALDGKVNFQTVKFSSYPYDDEEKNIYNFWITSQYNDYYEHPTRGHPYITGLVFAPGETCPSLHASLTANLGLYYCSDPDDPSKSCEFSATLTRDNKNGANLNEGVYWLELQDVNYKAYGQGGKPSRIMVLGCVLS